jgi:hypothetical protein
MHALKDKEVVTPILQRVILGELTLQEMGQEFKRLKTMATIQRAFLKCLTKRTWDECKTTYPKYCTDTILANIVPKFIGLVGLISLRSFSLAGYLLFVIAFESDPTKLVIASSEGHHRFKEEEDFQEWRGQGTNFLPREVYFSYQPSSAMARDAQQEQGALPTGEY